MTRQFKCFQHHNHGGNSVTGHATSRTIANLPAAGLRRVGIRFGLLAAVVIGAVSSAAVADDAAPKSEKKAVAERRSFPAAMTARAKAVAYLKSSQSEDGSWTVSASPGVSALVTYALLVSGVPETEPVIAKGLDNLSRFIKPDGGIYVEKSNHKNYETSLSLLAFIAANKGGKYDSVVGNATKFLRELQWDGTEMIAEDDPRFGGAGYGGSARPDLSNTSFLLDALKASGAGPDDPAIQNALKFVSRCQNLESEFNTTPFPSKVNDGGFYYTPAGGGNSQAGNTENGGLRSYASMTYSGLKSMIYAGVSPDDPRVKAATDWIKKHYRLTENPGLGKQGLYYYYHTFAKALATLDVAELTDADGVAHDWRKDLVEHLVSVQRENGSWVNDEARWMEGDPNLVTAYALLAVALCDGTHPALAEPAIATKASSKSRPAAK